MTQKDEYLIAKVMWMAIAGIMVLLAGLMLFSASGCALKADRGDKRDIQFLEVDRAVTVRAQDCKDLDITVNSTGDQEIDRGNKINTTDIKLEGKK